MLNLLNSKKMIVSLVGIVAVAGLVLAGRDMETVKWVGGFIASIVASLNLGQGLADGLSDGRTSASVQSADAPAAAPAAPSVVASAAVPQL
jgi:hypothetical protein